MKSVYKNGDLEVRVNDSDEVFVVLTAKVRKTVIRVTPCSWNSTLICTDGGSHSRLIPSAYNGCSAFIVEPCS